MMKFVLFFLLFVLFFSFVATGVFMYINQDEIVPEDIEEETENTKEGVTEEIEGEIKWGKYFSVEHQFIFDFPGDWEQWGGHASSTIYFGKETDKPQLTINAYKNREAFSGVSENESTLVEWAAVVLQPEEGRLQVQEAESLSKDTGIDGLVSSALYNDEGLLETSILLEQESGKIIMFTGPVPYDSEFAQVMTTLRLITNGVE